MVGMAQLLVRDIESAVVRRLRERAAALGVSVEEAHRRLLRETLLGDTCAPGQNLADYLQSMPRVNGPAFERQKDLPREPGF